MAERHLWGIEHQRPRVLCERAQPSTMTRTRTFSLCSLCPHVTGDAENGFFILLGRRLK